MTTDDDRRVVAAVAVDVRDGEACLVARQSRERLARGEPPGDRADQCDADHRHHQPEEPDHLAVPEQRSGPAGPDRSEGGPGRRGSEHFAGEWSYDQRYGWRVGATMEQRPVFKGELPLPPGPIPQEFR